MDLKKHGQRPYIIAAPMAFAVFFMGFCASAMLDSTWALSRHNLSDLGTGFRNLACALVFDYSCCLAGFLLSMFGVGKYIFEKGLDHISGIFFVLGGFGLFLVGVYNAEFLTAHNISAGLFAISMSTAIVLSTVSDIMKGDRFVLYTSIIILAYLALQWPLFKGALSECMAIGCATAWFLVQLYKYYKKGALTDYSKLVGTTDKVSGA